MRDWWPEMVGFGVTATLPGAWALDGLDLDPASALHLQGKAIVPR
jgi:hypothetical protein